MSVVDHHRENGHGQADRGAVAATAEQPVAVLRGARVTVDTKKLGPVAFGFLLFALLSAALALFLAGLHANGQITTLKAEGISVRARVVGCMGLLGGSGSNAAGYQCQATYSLDGRHHQVMVPGSTFYAPGTTLSAVAVRNDPALFTTTSALRAEHVSDRVYVLPSVLAVMAVSAGALFIFFRGRRGARPDHQIPLATRSVLS